MNYTSSSCHDTDKDTKISDEVLFLVHKFLSSSGFHQSAHIFQKELVSIVLFLLILALLIFYILLILL
jgi:hypothetical protein